MALIAGLRLGGLEISRDYDLVAKPMNDLIAMSHPEIIAVDEDFNRAGHELARMVIARIAGTEPFVLQMLDTPKPG